MASKIIFIIINLVVLSCGRQLGQDSSLLGDEPPVVEELDPYFLSHVKFSDALKALNKVAPAVIEAHRVEEPENIIEGIYGYLYINGHANPSLRRPLEIMKVSVIEEAKNKIENLSAEIMKKREAIDGLQMKRDGQRPDFPEEKPIIDWLPFYQSKGEYNRKIESIRQEIDVLVAERENCFISAQEKINTSLKSTLSLDQTRILLMSPDADMFVTAIAVFMNYNPFVQEMLVQIRENNPLNKTRLMYQGAYISLLGTLRLAQAQYLVKNAEQQKYIQDVNIYKMNKKIEKDRDVITTMSDPDVIDEMQRIINQSENYIAIANKYLGYLVRKEGTIIAAQKNLSDRLTSSISNYELINSSIDLEEKITVGVAAYSEIGMLILPDMTDISINFEELESVSKMLED